MLSHESEHRGAGVCQPEHVAAPQSGMKAQRLAGQFLMIE